MHSTLLRSVLPTLFLAVITVGCESPRAKGSATPHAPTNEHATATENAKGPTSRPAAVPAPASATLPPGEDHGAGVTLPRVFDFAHVMMNPENYAGEPILVRAEVMDVCKTKGCWIKITDGTHEARVKFLDYAFFLPKDCEGKVAWIEGTVAKQTIPVDVLKHYAAESGTENPDDITEPLTLVGFLASGVRLTDAP